MAKVVLGEIFICSDCGRILTRCLGCDKYFKNNEKIYCHAVTRVYKKHYCKKCRDDGTMEEQNGKI